LSGTDAAQLGEQAKKIAQAARRKAARIAANENVNRSTRRAQALRVKADALDQIAALK
jgi:hypothetical protein